MQAGVSIARGPEPKADPIAAMRSSCQGRPRRAGQRAGRARDPELCALVGLQRFDPVVHVVRPGRSHELGMLRHERIEAPQRCSDRHLVDRPIIIIIVIVALHAATIRATCAGANVWPLRRSRGVARRSRRGTAAQGHAARAGVGWCRRASSGGGRAGPLPQPVRITSNHPRAVHARMTPSQAVTTSARSPRSRRCSSCDPRRIRDARYHSELVVNPFIRETAS